MVLRHGLSGCAFWAAAMSTALILACGPGHAAGQFDTVYDFTGLADGATPNASVTVDLAGNIYGGAAQGGIECNDGSHSALGCGTIYKIDPAGRQTTLFSFTGADGVGPSTKLTLIGNALYGGTQAGGKYGYGVLFGVQTDGSGFKVLHNFTGQDDDGPVGTLIPAGDGAGLYGITMQGGPGHEANGYAHEGTLFELLRDGRLVILHAFRGKDGAEPTTLLMGQDGTLYGGAYFGGTVCVRNGRPVGNGCGTVFSYAPATGQFTTLYQFTGKRSDGAQPLLGSVDAAGNLYGVDYVQNEPASTMIFELMASKGAYTYRTLHQFAPTAGGEVASGPILLKDGSLAGVTEGEDNFGGVPYLLDPALVPDFKVLYTFPLTPGSNTLPLAQAQPFAGPRGVLYGTTSEGGTACVTSTGLPVYGGCGSVYKYFRSFIP